MEETGDYAWKASSLLCILGEAGVIQTLSSSVILKFNFSFGNVYGIGDLLHYINV